MGTFQNIQLNVKPRDRVKISIPEENLKFDCDKVYPQGGTATVIESKEQGIEHHLSLSDGGASAYVIYDEPFLRTGLLETLKEKGEKIRTFSDGEKKFKGIIRTTEWVPRSSLLRHENYPTWNNLLLAARERMRKLTGEVAPEKPKDQKKQKTRNDCRKCGSRATSIHGRCLNCGYPKYYSETLTRRRRCRS